MPDLGCGMFCYQNQDVLNLIEVMDRWNTSPWRATFNFDGLPWGHDINYTPSLVQYFLDNSSRDVIVSPNSIFPSVPSSSQYLIDNMQAAITPLQDICARWGTNARVLIEPVNEYYPTEWNDPTFATKFLSMVNQLIDVIRSAGGQNKIIVNWVRSVGSYDLPNDPFDNTAIGYHMYFDTPSRITEFQTNMNHFLDTGAEIFNSEIGAHTQEGGSFTQANVDALEQFIYWCWDRNISNSIWLYRDTQDWPVYESLGLELPTTPTPPPPECVIDQDCITKYGPNYVCQAGTCVYVPPPPPDCVLNEDCQAKYGDPAPGYMWVCEDGVCVQRKVVTPSLAARTVGPFGVPSSMLHQLWKLRQKYIRPEVHKKLHPVV